MTLERMWATWRSAYVSGASASDQSEMPNGCVFCNLLDDGASPESGIVYVGQHVACILNAYPYGSGHLLILPKRHEPNLLALTATESTELWDVAKMAVSALETAYRPQGMNLGANLGEAAGAGIPAHLHVHVLPRWGGDTNFMTSIGGSRVLSESLESTWDRVTASWPGVL